MSEIDHDHDEDGNCLPPEGYVVVAARPVERWSNWDLAGIALTWIGGLFSVTGQALNLLSRQCQAAGNFSRDRQEQREYLAAYEEHQRRAAEELRALVGDPTEDES